MGMYERIERRAKELNDEIWGTDDSDDDGDYDEVDEEDYEDYE